jgi:hypothetical protein
MAVVTRPGSDLGTTDPGCERPSDGGGVLLVLLDTEVAEEVLEQSAAWLRPCASPVTVLAWIPRPLVFTCPFLGLLPPPLHDHALIDEARRDLIPALRGRLGHDRFALRIVFDRVERAAVMLLRSRDYAQVLVGCSSSRRARRSARRVTAHAEQFCPVEVRSVLRSRIADAGGGRP